MAVSPKKSLHFVLPCISIVTLKDSSQALRLAILNGYRLQRRAYARLVKALKHRTTYLKECRLTWRIKGTHPNKTGVLMLRERGSKKVPVSHIKVSHHLSPSTRRTFLARPAFLQDMQRMTDDAIKSYIIQHPPIVYQAKGSKVDEQLLCLGNLHALYMAQKRFRASEKIRVTLVETPLSKQVDALAISLALSAEACHALSPKESGHYILALWEELDSSQPQELLKLSENFNSKAAVCDAFDLNRRVY